MSMELEGKNPDPKYGKNQVYVAAIFAFPPDGRRNGHNDCEGWMGVDLMGLMQIWSHPHPPEPGYFSEEFSSLMSENSH